MLFVGIDWAETAHAVCLLDGTGRVRARARIPAELPGVRQLHALIATHAGPDEPVLVALETDRGLLVQALRATDYQVYAINPLAASRYRERHALSRAKSDPGDAKLLADLLRTDRHNHRPLAVDSALAKALKVLARAHKDLIWQRQRHVNKLRSHLREFYPAALAAFGSDLAHRDARAVLTRAPTPAQGRQLSLRQLTTALRRGGRQRRLAARARQIQAALRTPQLTAPAVLLQAYRATVQSSLALIHALSAQIDALEHELTTHFEAHPDAQIIDSQPGLDVVLGARLLGEFGDDPTRFAHPKRRKAFAGTAPITRQSGRRKLVRRRFARHKRLADACQWWAFTALNVSPGARAYYDQHRAQGKSHQVALRALANRLVGLLHGCLARRQLYREDLAWPARSAAAA